MELLKISNKLTFFVLFSIILRTQSATVKDIFNLNSPEIVRVERDSQYYNRYGAATGQTSQLRPIKPEESPEARENDKDNTGVEKRCTRCDYTSRERDYRNPYESRVRYDDRYDDRYRSDRYDDRYRDRYYDDYDRRPYEAERRPYETDRRYMEYDRKYDDRSGYYDRDRYDRRPEYYDRDRYDKDDKYRYYERNYDRYDRGYKPWDESTRGSSGFDGSGRGYYYAAGRPESGGYGPSYASSWNYGGKRDYNRDSDRNWRDQGFSSGSYRPRDPYDPGYNRGTSYLYGRPSSSTTTQPPSPSGDTTVTSNSQLLDNTSSG